MKDLIYDVFSLLPFEVLSAGKAILLQHTK
jgi:hypothetical protein